MTKNRRINEQTVTNSITSVVHHIPKIFDFVSLHDNTGFAIYDTPGLNDALTKSIYYKYVDDNFHLINIIIFVLEITSAMNTSDQMDMLKLILRNIKNQRLIILVNKCDDMVVTDDGCILLDDEKREIFNQAKEIIDATISESGGNQIKYDIIPFSCELTYIYRMHQNDKIDKIDMKYINKFGNMNSEKHNG